MGGSDTCSSVGCGVLWGGESVKQVGLIGCRVKKQEAKVCLIVLGGGNLCSLEGEPKVSTCAENVHYLVFIEVRTKRSLEFGSPEQSITPAKMERLRATAANYQQTHDNLPPLWRIDVVAIELNEKGKPSRIELIENAVSDE